jgi:hypothetical protein
MVGWMGQDMIDTMVSVFYLFPYFVLGMDMAIQPCQSH